MKVTAEQVLSALKDLKDPSSGRSMSEVGYFKHPEMLDGGGVRVRVELPTPASPHKAGIDEAVRAMLSPLQLPRVEVAFDANVRPSPSKQHNPNDLVPSVKNVVLVGSGKGGVGKSTVSANVAVALANLGCKVGLFFFQAEDGIRDLTVTGVQTCALPIYARRVRCARYFPFLRVLGNDASADVFPDRDLGWERARLRRDEIFSLHHGGLVADRSEEHTSELQSQSNLVCRLLLETKKTSEHL